MNLPIVHAYLALPLLRSHLGAHKLGYIQIGGHFQMRMQFQCSFEVRLVYSQY